MDIHKPKPWHGLREFLKEYVIIVIGVLTALAAEGGVEWLHWRHETENERDALHEAARIALGSMKFHMALQPCINQRLSELDVLLQRHDRRQPLGLIGRVGAPISPEGDNGAWSLGLSGGGLNHMSQDERLRFSYAFNAYAVWNRDA